MTLQTIDSQSKNINLITSNNQWCVYILECQDNSFYTGITNNLEKRMDSHKSGKGSKYVKIKGFKRLLHIIKAVDKIATAKLEYKIKKLEKNEKITFFMKHPMLDFSISKQK